MEWEGANPGHWVSGYASLVADCEKHGHFGVGNPGVSAYTPEWREAELC